MNDTTTRETDASDMMKQGMRAAQRAGDVAAEAVQRGAETARAAAGTAEQMQSEALARARQELGEAGRTIIDNSKDNAEKLRTLLTLPAAAEGGLQDMQGSLVGLVHGVIRTNLGLMEGMLHVQSPRAYVELQQRFIREYLDGLLQGMTLLVRAARRTADETLRPLERGGNRPAA
jgi:hypothetical protein